MYWLCKSSLGQNWGEDGYLKIARGSNQNDIENSILGFKWNCPAGQTVDEDGKCTTKACASNQYLSNNDCNTCPMHAPAEADNSACILRSAVPSYLTIAGVRYLKWRNYGNDSAKLVALGSNHGEKRLDVALGPKEDFTGTRTEAYAIEVALRAGEKFTFGVRPEVIPNNDPVYLINTSDNEGYIINDDGCYPPSPLNKGPIVNDVHIFNFHTSDVEIYQVEWNGDLIKKGGLVGSDNQVSIQQAIYTWENFNIGTKLAIKIKDGEWIYVGEVSHRDLLISGQQVQWTIHSDDTVIKEFF